MNPTLAQRIARIRRYPNLELNPDLYDLLLAIDLYDAALKAYHVHDKIGSCYEGDGWDDVRAANAALRKEGLIP